MINAAIKCGIKCGFDFVGDVGNQIILQPETDKVLHYTMDSVTIKNGIVYDVSGLDSNAINSGGTLVSDGLSFDGVNDFLTLISKKNLGKTCAITFRFKYNAISSTSYFLGGETINEFGFRYNGSNFLLIIGGTSYNDTIDVSLVAGIEYSITLSRDGTNVGLYLNGQLIDTFTNANWSTYDSIINFIGKRADGYFTSMILDDIKMYVDSFSAAQALAYHNLFNQTLVFENFVNYQVGAITNEGTGSFEIVLVSSFSDVVNDDAADDGTASWDKNDCTLIFDTDHYNVVYSALTQHIHRIISTTQGKMYQLTCKVKDGTLSGVNGNIYLYTGLTSTAGINKAFTTNTEWQAITVNGIAESGYTTFGIYSAMTSAGNYQIKDIVLTEIPALPNLAATTKHLNCTTDGTYLLKFDGDTSTPAKIDYFDGTTWYSYFDTIANLITTHSWLTLTDEYLTFTLTSGEKINRVVIYDDIHLAQNILYSGSSTTASYLGTPSVASMTNMVLRETDISVPGDTIAAQTTAYKALPPSIKNSIEVAFVMIGGNNMNTETTTAEAINELKAYLAEIRIVSPYAKIYLATLNPFRERLIDLYGEVDGEASYQKWLSYNEAIRGAGDYALTSNDRDYYFDQHTDDLNDGSGNLKAIYDLGDHIHMNEAGKQLIVDAFITKLSE